MSTGMSRFHSVRESFRRFAASDRGRRAAKIIQGLLGAVVVVILAVQLSQIGWREFISELPTTPWFYATVLVMYFALPLFETGIYGRYWNAPKTSLFSVFVRKKVLNNDLAGYSGEVYLHFWTRQHLDSSNRRPLRLIVDNNITSSLAGYSSTGLLLGVLLMADQIAVVDLVGRRYPVIITAAVLIGAGVGFAAYRFRHTIFGQSGRDVLWMYAIHFGRFLLMFSLQIFQWWVVVPDAPFITWGTMYAVMTVSNRLPFIPARDIAAIAVILELNLPVSAAVIAGLMVSRSVLDRGLNLVLFVPLSMRGALKEKPSDHSNDPRPTPLSSEDIDSGTSLDHDPLPDGAEHATNPAE